MAYIILYAQNDKFILFLGTSKGIIANYFILEAVLILSRTICAPS